MRRQKKGRPTRVTLPLHSQLEDLISSDLIKITWVAGLIRKKLIALKVPIKEKDFDEITAQVRKRFRGEDGLTWESQFNLDLEYEGAVKLNFDSEDLEGFNEFVTQGMSSAVQEAVDACAPLMLEEILSELDDEHGRRIRMMNGFRDRILTRWSKPLKYLNAQISLAARFGQDTNAWLRNRPSEGISAAIEAVTRLQARATQVAWEVEVLLQHGFADGALSRWRTLHEICIVALFIQQEGEETAQRYLDHLRVDSRDFARFLKKAERGGGDAGVTDDVLTQIEEEVESLCIQHGDAFDGYYGWAWNAIESKRKVPKKVATKKGGVNFFDIEEAVDMDRLRPYYKLASRTIHAGPKGAFLKLGLRNNDSNTILAGPSNVGLSEAGRLTAWSLGMSCVALMMVEPMLDGTAWCRVIDELGTRAGKSFEIAERHLQEEDGIDARRSKKAITARPHHYPSEKLSTRLRRRMGK
jgi:hypothetical protein